MERYDGCLFCGREYISVWVHYSRGHVVCIPCARDCVETILNILEIDTITDRYTIEAECILCSSYTIEDWELCGGHIVCEPCVSECVQKAIKAKLYVEETKGRRA